MVFISGNRIGFDVVEAIGAFFECDAEGAVFFLQRTVFFDKARNLV